MKQIKFRAWDKLAKIMYYPESFGGKGMSLFLNGQLSNFQNGSGGDEYEVMEWTGLTDKEGKDVYEGDIVKWTHPMEDIGVVEYIVNSDFQSCYPNVASFCVKTERLGACLFQSDDEYEVIGNIFESPNLLP